MTARGEKTLVVLEGAAQGVAAFPLLPSETGLDGVALDQDEALRLSPLYSELYLRLSGAVARRLGARFALAHPAALVLARRAVVPLAHCFLDRLIRLERLVEQKGSGALAVASAVSRPAAPDIEVLQGLAASSVAFNLHMLERLAPLWGVSTEAEPLPLPPEPAPVDSGVNHNFQSGAGLRRLLRKAWAKLVARPLSARLALFPTLSMAYATDALRAESLYFRLLSELPTDWPLDAGPPLPDLRDEVLAAALNEERAALEAFLDAAGVVRAPRSEVHREFVRFFVDFYPPSMLESAASNSARCAERLGRFSGRALLFSDVNDTRATHMKAAAKGLGMEIIGFQHAGHYGYLEDYADALELEYPVCDRFITWGWSRLPPHPACAGTVTVPLPSPWLSERRRYWSARRARPVVTDKPFDLLLMSNKVKRLLPAPAGAVLSRRDRVREFAASLQELVRTASASGVRLLHKPYDPSMLAMLPETFRELERLGGVHYRLLDRPGKGLTSELLDECHAVLWDQPGTGFLECLASGLPTMVYWPRVYNQEEPWVRSEFAELEAVGIVHRRAETLAEQALLLRASPSAWHAEPRRREAAERFARRYAWADDDWAARWREFLGTLPRRAP